MRVFFNGLSMGTGGGLTVGRELAYHLALERPAWQVDLLAIEGQPLHAELIDDPRCPDNLRLLWAPGETAGRVSRSRYEKRSLGDQVLRESADIVLQLNGMIVPGMPVPTVSHFQDPWPYRPEAWTQPRRHAVLAWLKRKAHRRALRGAAAATWTSQYLADLITGQQGIKPARSEVLHNGVPDDWLNRTAANAVPLADRPRRIVTISTVDPYKRQWLVIDAVAELQKRYGIDDLHYHVAGATPPSVRDGLERRIAAAGLQGRIHLEGRVSDERAQELFASSRAYVLMSVCESFGIPAVEAMTFGTPVVVADCCAIPEVCRDAGWNVPIDDLVRLTDSLHQALTDPAAAAAAVSAGFENAQRFRWSATAARLGGMIESLER